MAVSTNPVIVASAEATTTVAEVTATAAARTTWVVVIGTLALVVATVVATRLGTREQQIAEAGKRRMLPMCSHGKGDWHDHFG
jgi:hypothetical protein